MGFKGLSKAESEDSCNVIGDNVSAMLRLLNFRHDEDVSHEKHVVVTGRCLIDSEDFPVSI